MRRWQALWERGVELWGRWERHISALGLLIGFCFDVIVADRPDSTLNNLLLLFYLFAAASLIVILNLRSVLREREEGQAEPLFLLFVLQVCFGALASNLLVLYGRSGTLVGSALFIGLLLAMLVGNEFLRTRYSQLRFNVAVYYVLLLSYLLIALPTFVFHAVGAWVFIASGIASLALIALFLGVMYYTILRGRNRERQLVEVGSIVFCIFLVFNALYALKVIPPVPLSLKDIGIYHSIERVSGGYSATYEKPPWWKFWRGTNATYSLASGGSAYCFSSVFAPDDLRTPILHRWQKQDEHGEWVTVNRVSFPISGGRTQGYRGFSQTMRLSPGTWRCNVEIPGGALIGRITFTAVPGSPPAFSTKTL